MKRYIKISFLTLMALIIDLKADAPQAYRLFNFTSQPLYAAYYYDKGLYFERNAPEAKYNDFALYSVNPGDSVNTKKPEKRSTLLKSNRRNLVVTHQKKLLKHRLPLFDNVEAYEASDPVYNLPHGLYQVHVKDKETKAIVCTENLKAEIVCTLCSLQDTENGKIGCERTLNRLRNEEFIRKR